MDRFQINAQISGSQHVSRSCENIEKKISHGGKTKKKQKCWKKKGHNGVVGRQKKCVAMATLQVRKLRDERKEEPPTPHRCVFTENGSGEKVRMHAIHELEKQIAPNNIQEETKETQVVSYTKREGDCVSVQ